MDEAVIVTEQYSVTRPAQLLLRGIRLGIAGFGEQKAELQVHVDDAPIRRVLLGVGESADVDGWSVRLDAVDRGGRGSVDVTVGHEA